MPINIGLVCNRSDKFKTTIDDCISFSVENRGNTLAYLSFDDGDSEIDLLPGNTFREFTGGSGEVYKGEMTVTFGAISPDAEAGAVPQNLVNVVKNIKKAVI